MNTFTMHRLLSSDVPKVEVLKADFNEHGQAVHLCTIENIQNKNKKTLEYQNRGYYKHFSKLPIKLSVEDSPEKFSGCSKAVYYVMTMRRFNIQIAPSTFACDMTGLRNGKP